MIWNLLIFTFIFLCFSEIRSSIENVNTEKPQNSSGTNNYLVKIEHAQFYNNLSTKTITENNPDSSYKKATNETKIFPKKRVKKYKRKRKNNHLEDAITQNFLKETTILSTNATINRSKKGKRRKRKRKNLKNFNIFEITTAKIETGIIPENDLLNFTKENNLSTSTIKSQQNPKFQKSLKQNYVGTLKPKNSKKLNRCSKNNGGCSQLCRLRGKRKCSCLKGYYLAKNRKTCIDVDECRISNGGCEDICRNTPGAYFCDCSSGFRLGDDLRSCQDINECHLRNDHGPCQDTCTNTLGSYICDCSHLNGTRLGNDKHSCEDINECEETRHGCSHFCINTKVGAFCSCPEGMELMSDYKTCQDIDECEDSSIKSSCKVGCINTIGSYYCEDDFQNDADFKKSKVSSCPPLNPPEYGYITCLRSNTRSLYDTFTRNGRRIIKNSPGTKCQLKCPIGFRLVGGGRFVCSTTGKWVLKKKGTCLKSSHPKLECPPDQKLTLEKEKETISISFPRPRTNIRWQIVESYPKWAKHLKGELTQGNHLIQFSVTDPASKLSSTCSFLMTVEK